MSKQAVNKQPTTLMTQMYPTSAAPKAPKQGTKKENGRIYNAPKDQQQGKVKPLF